MQSVGSFGNQVSALSWSRILAALVVFLAAEFVLVPWHARLDYPGGDDMYVFAYHELFVHKAAFGRDYVFTSGPLGFLYFLFYHPGTYQYLVAYYVPQTALIAWAIVAGVRKSGLGLVTQVVIGLFVVGFFVLSRDAKFYFLAVCAVVWASEERRDRALGWIAIALLGIAALAKTPFAVAGLVAAFGASAIEIAQRRFPVSGLVFVVSVFIAWSVIASQAIVDFPDFVSLSLEYVYIRDAMAEVGVFALPRFYVSVAVGLVVFLILLRDALLGGITDWTIALTMTLLLFLGYKAGHVGLHDAEHNYTLSFFVATAAIVVSPKVPALVGVWERFANRLVRQASVLVALLLGAVGVVYYLADKPHFYVNKGERLRQALAGLIDFPSGGAKLRAEFDEVLAELRRTHPLPPLTGEVCLVGWQSPYLILLANGLNMRPMPTLHNSAFSSRLDAFVRDYFESDRAPEHVILKPGFGLTPGPRRSELAIAERYESSGVTVLGQHFKHRDQPRALIRFGEADRRLIAVGERTPMLLDQDRGVWINILPRITFLGRLIGLLYIIPNFYMTVETEAGIQRRYTVGRFQGGTGFVLSPRFVDGGDLARIEDPEFWREPDRRVAAIRIDLIPPQSGYPRWLAEAFFEPMFEIELRSVQRIAQ